MSSNTEMWCPLCGHTVDHPLRSIICCPQCNDTHERLTHYVLNLEAREQELQRYCAAASHDDISQLSVEERRRMALFVREMRRHRHAIELAQHGEIGAREARSTPLYLYPLTRTRPPADDLDPFDDPDDWSDAPTVWIALPDPDDRDGSPHRWGDA